MSDVRETTDTTWDADVLKADLPVLVDFWAPWCGPCKMIAPALDDLAGTYAGRAKIVKVDVDQNQATAMRYHVRSIPMLLLFKGGQVQATQIGAVGKAGQRLDPLGQSRCACGDGRAATSYRRARQSGDGRTRHWHCRSASGRSKDLSHGDR